MTWRPSCKRRNESPAHAQSVSYDSGMLNAPIPDDTDTGIVLTLDVTESFAVADIRVSYRTVVTGSENVAFGGLLSGAWRPDGRATDPSSVVTGDPRPLLLGEFAGLDSAGT